MADKPDASKPKGSGLARFAYLLDPNADHTISRPPVTYDKPDDGSKSSEQHSEATSKTGNDPAFPKFNPQKRPKQTKKPKLPGSAPKPSPSEQPPDASEPGSGVQHNIHHIEDWAAEDEDADVFQNGPKRQRGGRKKRKKDQVTYDYATDWDAIYDPLKPNVYEAYIGSEEEVRAEREWKDYLYKNSRRGMKREESGSSQESDDRAQKKPNFAPPANLFAPPAFDSELEPVPSGSPSAPHHPRPPPPRPPPVADLPDDTSGEDAYMRRIRMSQMTASTATPPPPEPEHMAVDLPPPPPASEHTNQTTVEPSPQAPSYVISRAPVRYTLPEASASIPHSEAELQADMAKLEQEILKDSELNEPQKVANDDEEPQERTNRPGQKGFAKRLMEKYGWEKGAGLGVQGTGIATPLSVQVEKRKKKSDMEGGGWSAPGGMGTIVGGKQSKAARERAKAEAEDPAAKANTLSNVIMLRNMLDGLNLDAEMTAENGGIMQEIGDECNGKYGNVERIYIHREEPPVVFVKFTEQISALRAVDALSGRNFGGNTIDASFYDTESFDRGVYA